MNAQPAQLNQVIVLNEGPWGGPVTVGSFDPVSKNYSVFDTINARFATDAIIEDEIIYVAADTLLLKYDANTRQLLDQQTVQGIRELATWNNQVLVSRGEINGLPSYFQAYDKNTLDFIYELTAISADAAEVKVVGDTAYMAVNNFGIGSVGKLAIIDLQNQVLNREVDLGPDGVNPENVEVGQNGDIITVNSLDWSNISVTRYDINTSNAQSIKLGASSGCGASALSHMGQVYFQQGDNFNGTVEPLERNLGVYDAATTLGFWDTLMINKQIYGMGIDSVNGRIYVGSTDFSSYGKIFVFDFYGTTIDSFDVGISPGTLTMDVRLLTNVNSGIPHGTDFRIYPNPGKEEFTIYADETLNSVVIRNILGEIILNSRSSKNFITINLANYSEGVYFAEITTDHSTITRKLVKE